MAADSLLDPSYFVQTTNLVNLAGANGICSSVSERHVPSAEALQQRLKQPLLRVLEVRWVVLLHLLTVLTALRLNNTLSRLTKRCLQRFGLSREL
ncbi:hypothetical protein [Corallococcus interemptor]|nr:hypothetical protein [Corallococcus interemptor]RKH49602.1 hypothetical protein D7Y23_16090 [Corallococcus sp. AB050B]